MASGKEYIPITELISLTHKTAIVTGGAMGIGFAISHRLAEAGVSITIVDSNGEQAEKVSEELVNHGYQATFIQCDVSREEEVLEMVSTTVREMGGVDILINNAGVYRSIPLQETTGEDFERMISVNLKGTFLCSREVSRRMIERGQGGCIINIASIESVHPSYAGLAAYDASKGGVLMLTKSMALELGRHDIRVNAIAPGGIVTEGMFSCLDELPLAQGREPLKRFMARIPLGRMGRADDIGRVALFLTSDLASYITGSLIVVDGGYLLS